MNGRKTCMECKHVKKMSGITRVIIGENRGPVPMIEVHDSLFCTKKDVLILMSTNEMCDSHFSCFESKEPKVSPCVECPCMRCCEVINQRRTK